ncbi:hypothetical protein [Fibrisoma limi]|uniref:hypothetical protein n=1 Tax=Fibrisoma limi TaxID=663275 RepID=UPI00058765D3|nr:hypothetical protein [Fibrisoma limi]
MAKVDTEQLVRCINNCFDLAGDDRLSLNRRSEMLALGKRLRGSLLNLLTAEFSEDLTEVEEANQQLEEVNEQLSNVEAAINKIAETVELINDLVEQLDNLLKFAVNFF